MSREGREGDWKLVSWGSYLALLVLHDVGLGLLFLLYCTRTRCVISILYVVQLSTVVSIQRFSCHF